MAFELDMVIDGDPADAPFGKAIGLRRQRFEVGPGELFEQRPAGDTQAPDQAFVVELPQQLADRRIEFGQTLEATMAKRPSSHRSMISTVTLNPAFVGGGSSLCRASDGGRPIKVCVESTSSSAGGVHCDRRSPLNQARD
jgi:hypothetical protein